MDDFTKMDPIFTENESYYYKLIGVANLYLDILFSETCVPFEYNIPIINQQGEVAGRLNVKLQRLNKESSGDASPPKSDDESLSSLGENQTKKLKFRLSINRAYDLPINLNNIVFCQYKFWCHSNQTIVICKDSTDSEVFFDHETEISLDINDDYLEYCLDGGFLSIEIISHRNDIAKSMNDNSTRSLKVYQERLLRLNQLAKFQSLVDAWSKVSQSFELDVKILELNSEGCWKPVEVKQNQINKTGGIYQLRQGQSRQISKIITTKINLHRNHLF